MIWAFYSQINPLHNYDVDTILRLAKKFPQLKLDTSECLDYLKEEFDDFLLSPSEIQPLITTYSAWDPSFKPYRGAEIMEKPKPGAFWHRNAEM